MNNEIYKCKVLREGVGGNSGFKIHCCIDWIFYTYSGTHFLPPSPHSVFWHFLSPVRLNVPSHVRICAITINPPYLLVRFFTTERVTYNNGFFSSMAQQPPGVQVLLIIEDSRPHTVTLHSAELLWTKDQPDAETSTRQHTTLKTDRPPCPPAGFEPAIPTNERPQNYALGRANTGMGCNNGYSYLKWNYVE